MLGTHTAGDTLRYTVALADYPAGTWTLSYRLTPRTAGGTAYSFSATASGADHLVDVPAATTAAWVPGWYTLSAWVTSGAQRFQVASEQRQVQILADASSLAAGTDSRTQAELALEQARAALAAWTPTTRSYTIAGRSITFNSTAEIIQLIGYWQGEVQRERRAASIAAGNPDRRRQIFVRMGRA